MVTLICRGEWESKDDATVDTGWDGTALPAITGAAAAAADDDNDAGIVDGSKDAVMTEMAS